MMMFGPQPVSHCQQLVYADAPHHRSMGVCFEPCQYITCDVPAKPAADPILGPPLAHAGLPSLAAGIGTHPLAALPPGDCSV